MMSNTLVKVGVGLTGVTVIGGGVATIYLTSSGNTKAQKQDEPPKELNTSSLPTPDKVISTLFEKAKVQKLTDEGTDADAWKERWTAFKDAYENNLKVKDSWTFDNWENAKSQEDSSISILKQKCNTNSGQKVVDENSPLFLDVKAYCTKPIADSAGQK